jgi:pyrroline-5-carboxylate reductase
MTTTKAISELKVGIFGVGVMGEALLAGLLSAGVTPDQIYFVEKREERATEISQKYGVHSSSLEAVASQSDLILMVVKPQDLGELVAELDLHLNTGALLVSFAAGKSTHFIESRLATPAAVIRVMPNTPLLVGAGASVLSAGANATSSQIDLVTDLLSPNGLVLAIDESLQDAVTATSGSGPAYFFAFVEAMVEGSVALGMPPDVATKLTIQTIVGAAGMLTQTGISATTLRENVTSPNGTTAAALHAFTDGELNALVAKAMRAARDRSQELA